MYRGKKNQINKSNKSQMINEDSDSNDSLENENENEQNLSENLNENLENILNSNSSKKGIRKVEEKLNDEFENDVFASSMPQNNFMGMSKISSLPKKNTKFFSSDVQAGYLNLANEIGNNCFLNKNNSEDDGNGENYENNDINSYHYLNLNNNKILSQNKPIQFPLSQKQFNQFVKFLGAIVAIKKFTKKKDLSDSIKLLVEFTYKKIKGKNVIDLSFYNNNNTSSTSHLSIKITEETTYLFDYLNSDLVVDDEIISLNINADYEVLKKLIIDKNYALFIFNKVLSSAHLKIESEDETTQIHELEVVSEEYSEDIAKQICTLSLNENIYFEFDFNEQIRNQFKPIYFEKGYDNFFFNYDKGELSIEYSYKDGNFFLRLQDAKLLTKDKNIRDNIDKYFPIYYDILNFTEHLKTGPDVIKLYFTKNFVAFDRNDFESGIKLNFIATSTAVQ